MAKFFISSNVVHKEKTFQFNFETDEADSVDDLMDILESGRSVCGDKFHPAAPAAGRQRMAITLGQVGLVQEIIASA